MSDQFDNINEKAKRIEAALKYTDGDMSSAKLMASGKLQDVTVIKGKFIIPDMDTSGFFLAFINVANEYISAIRTVMSSNSSIFTRLRIFDDWKSLYKNMQIYETGDDVVESDKLCDDLIDSFIKADVFPDVQSLNLDYLSVAVQDILKESFGTEQIKTQVDLEQSNSMDVDLAGISIMVPEVEQKAEQEFSAPQQAEEKSDFDRVIDAIEERAKFIVEGESVLSPVKGVFVNEVKQGEKIYVMLRGNDDVSSKILDAYKARDDEGNPQPVLGRIVDKVSNEGNGYVLYALVAKGIYAKIFEEENVKIQTEITKAKRDEPEVKSGNGEGKTVLSVLVYIVFVMMIGGLIFLLFML